MLQGAVNGTAGSPGKPVPPPREPLPRPLPPAATHRNLNNNTTAELSKEPTKQQLDSIKKYQVSGHFPISSNKNDLILLRARVGVGGLDGTDALHLASRLGMLVTCFLSILMLENRAMLWNRTLEGNSTLPRTLVNPS